MNLGVRLGPTPLEGPVPIPDHRPSLSHSVLLAGYLRGWRWWIELVGAPLDPVDREYLPGNAAHPMLTGYSWGLRLELVRLSRRTERPPWELSVALNAAGTGGRTAEPVWVEHRAALTTASERSVLWRLIRPDAATRDRMAEAFLGEPGAEAILLLPRSPPVWLPAGSQVVTVWRPLRPGRVTDTLGSPPRPRGLGAYVAVDARARPQEVRLLPPTVRFSGPPRRSPPHRPEGEAPAPRASAGSTVAP